MAKTVQTLPRNCRLHRSATKQELGPPTCNRNTHIHTKLLTIVLYFESKPRVFFKDGHVKVYRVHLCKNLVHLSQQAIFNEVSDALSHWEITIAIVYPENTAYKSTKFYCTSSIKMYTDARHFVLLHRGPEWHARWASCASWTWNTSGILELFKNYATRKV